MASRIRRLRIVARGRTVRLDRTGCSHPGVRPQWGDVHLCAAFAAKPNATVFPAATFSGNWKMPYAGAVHLVQGGAQFGSGTCDGGACFLTSHFGLIGHALDWQQVAEEGQGNSHILAIEDGTVVGTTNTVTCTTGSATCQVGHDDYTPACNDPNAGLGNYVSIAHPDGSFSFYGHLKSGSVQVPPTRPSHKGPILPTKGTVGGPHITTTVNAATICTFSGRTTRRRGRSRFRRIFPSFPVR